MSEIYVLKVKWKVVKNKTRKAVQEKQQSKQKKKENNSVNRKRLVMKKSFKHGSQDYFLGKKVGAGV